jgi:hypothetical protein
MTNTATPEVARTRREPPTYLVLMVFTLIAGFMTLRTTDLGSQLVGNSGDALFIQWTIGWVQHSFFDGWNAIWDANIFSPAPDTLAYADALLPVALVEWPLRAIFGETLGFNVLYLAAETASLWFMYRLAVRLTGSWPASVVAAMAWSFAAPRMILLGHPQLTTVAFMIPLILLLVIRYFDRPTVPRGMGIGLAVALLATSSSYYGATMAIVVPVLVLGYLAWFRPPNIRGVVVGLAAGAAVAAVIALPVAIRYVDLQQDPYFEREVAPQFEAELENFVAPHPAGYLLPDLPFFDRYLTQPGPESFLFPGIIALGFGTVGIVVVVRGVRRRNEDARRALLIVGTGVVALVLAFGNETTIFGIDVPMPFRLVREIVPGFSGIRAPVRLVVMAQCALALLAAFGVRALLQHFRRSTATAIAAVLVVIVLAETATRIPLVRVPDATTSVAVNEELERRPDGVVAELPMKGLSTGVEWAFLESPRQLVGLIDANDRINGYSGYVPKGYDDLVREVNAFPSNAALRALAEHDVRYVVLRLRVVGQQEPGVDAALRVDGSGRYSAETARRMISELPPDRVRDVQRLPGAYLIELRRPTTSSRNPA